MPRHERRLRQPMAGDYRSTIPANFRILRSFSQALAADWYGTSERTWRRWEQAGAPDHVLKRIAAYARSHPDDAFWLVKHSKAV